MRRARTMIAGVAAALSAASLAACVKLLPDAGPPAEIFRVSSPDLASLSAEAETGATGAPTRDLVLRIGEPTTAQSLDSDRLVIIDANDAMGFIAGARWAETTPRLWQTAMIERFEADGAFRAAVRPEDGVRPNLDLRVDLRDFEILYDDRFDALPKARGRVSVKLVDAASRKLVAATAFEAEHEAEDAKLNAMVAALEAVVDDLSSRLVAWSRDAAAAESAGEAAPDAPAAAERPDPLKGGAE